MDTTAISTIESILHSLAFILLYFVIGFGPGFIIGMLLANRFTAGDKQLRVEKHNDNIKKAGDHNSQWHPDNTKWQ